MAKLTRDNLIKWSSALPEGWSFDAQRFVIWGDKRIYTDSAENYKGVFYRATLEYYPETEGEGWSRRETGRQIPTLAIHRYTPTGADSSMCSVVRVLSSTVGETQKNRNYKALVKLAGEIDVSAYFEQAAEKDTGKPYNSLLDELEQGTAAQESTTTEESTETTQEGTSSTTAPEKGHTAPDAALLEGMRFVDVAGEVWTITRLDSMSVELNHGTRSIYDFGTSRTVAAVLSALGDGSRILSAAEDPAEDTTEDAPEVDHAAEAPAKPYKTAEDITAAFIAEGWSADTVLRDATPEEIADCGYYIQSAAADGRKFYIMEGTGNMFDDSGEVVYYNVPANVSTPGEWHPVDAADAAEDTTPEQESAENPENAQEDAGAQESAAVCNDAPEDNAPQESAQRAPSSFEALALAYLTGKKPPKKAQQRTTPKPQEEKPQEPTPAPEEPPAPPAPGYHENDNGQMDEDERKALSANNRVIQEERFHNYAFFSAPYSERVRLIYRIPGTSERDTITPGVDPRFAGLLIDGNYYAAASEKDISAKLSADIEQKLKELVPTEADAAHAAANIESDYERERIEQAKEHDYTHEAREAFYRGNKPELCLYAPMRPGYNWDCLIAYILDPEKVIEESALRYLCDYPEKVYRAYIRYNRLSAAYSAIVSNPEHEVHKIKRIAASVDDEKTVRLQLTNGASVRCDASAIKYIPFRDRINAWDIVAADRDRLPKNEYNRPADIYPADIVEIRHGARILYTA